MQTHETDALETAENSDQSEHAIIFTCDDCEIGFNTQRGLQMHRINAHKDDITLDLNECEECGISFETLSDLNEHMHNEHDEIDSKCDICKQEFTSQKLFDDHRFEHEMNDGHDAKETE